MFGKKSVEAWLKKPADVMKDVLSKYHRRAHPYLYMGSSLGNPFTTGRFVQGNVIEQKHVQNDPHQSLSTLHVKDSSVLECIAGAVQSMLPQQLASLPDGGLNLNNLMAAHTASADIETHRSGALIVRNFRNQKEPLVVFAPAISQHFLDRYIDTATERHEIIMAYQEAYKYTLLPKPTQSGRVIIGDIPENSPIAALAARVSAPIFIGQELIAPTLSKATEPEFTPVRVSEPGLQYAVYTLGSRYVEDTIEITMSKPFNFIFGV